MVGSFLGISFTTNDSRILTLSNYRRSESARTAVHTPIFGKPRTEYLGRELKKVTFSIQLNALNGVRPRYTEEKIINKIGDIGNLVIGGKKVGFFMLKAVDSSYETTTRDGELVLGSIDLTLEEYA